MSSSSSNRMNRVYTQSGRLKIVSDESNSKFSVSQLCILYTLSPIASETVVYAPHIWCSLLVLYELLSCSIIPQHVHLHDSLYGIFVSVHRLHSSSAHTTTSPLSNIEFQISPQHKKHFEFVLSFFSVLIGFVVI